MWLIASKETSLILISHASEKLRHGWSCVAADAYVNDITQIWSDLLQMNLGTSLKVLKL